MNNLQFTIYNSLKKHCTFSYNKLDIRNCLSRVLCPEYVEGSPRGKLEIRNSCLRQDGFTLIELLVAVAIIGILASFMIANFVGTRQRARDAQRKSDIRQIQTALEYYKADDGLYPADTATFQTCGSEFLRNTTVYMKTIPCDPIASSPKYYYYIPSGCDATIQRCTGYILYACLENPKDNERDDDDGGPKDLCSGTTISYTLSNPS